MCLSPASSWDCHCPGLVLGSGASPRSRETWLEAGPLRAEAEKHLEVIRTWSAASCALSSHRLIEFRDLSYSRFGQQFYLPHQKSCNLRRFSSPGRTKGGARPTSSPTRAGRGSETLHRTAGVATARGTRGWQGALPLPGPPRASKRE